MRLIKLRDKKELRYMFDKSGNLYFYRPNNLEELISLSIEKNNNLVCTRFKPETNIEFSDKNLVVGELKPLDDNNTLRGKMIKEMLEDDEDDEGDYDNFNVTKEYYQEDLEFNEYFDDNKASNKVNPYFAFSVVNGEMISKLISNKIDDGLALYDTLIYSQDGGDETKLILKTTLVGDMPIYRLLLFTDGEDGGYIKFRPIGSSEKSYNISDMINSLN